MRTLTVLTVAVGAASLGVVASTAEGAQAPRRAAPPSPPCPAPAPRPATPALTGAFGVLRRDRADADALPRAALEALQVRGIVPTDPAAARLLRTTPGGGRAWVVPVADVDGPCVRVAPPPARPRPLPLPRPRPPRADRRTPPAPAPRRPPPPPLPARPPREGLAVVATGDAPSGAGGALRDLVRGLSSPAVEPCAGPNRDMVSVSGIVPDGVGVVHLTSGDGTAVRADVRDNGYAFVVAGTRRPEPRYVVWTGGDGTPHVQPVIVMRPPAPCRTGGPPRVTLHAGPPCLPLAAPPPGAARSRRGRPPLLVPAPCLMPGHAAPPRPRRGG